MLTSSIEELFVVEYNPPYMLFLNLATCLLHETTASTCVSLTWWYAQCRYILVNLIALFSWWRSQRIDEDEYGGIQALMGEGLPPSIGLFLVRILSSFVEYASGGTYTSLLDLD